MKQRWGILAWVKRPSKCKGLWLNAGEMPTGRQKVEKARWSLLHVAKEEKRFSTLAGTRLELMKTQSSKAIWGQRKSKHEQRAVQHKAMENKRNIGTSGCKIWGYSLIQISNATNADCHTRDVKIQVRLSLFFPIPLVWATKKAVFLHTQAIFFAPEKIKLFFWIAVPPIFLTLGMLSQTRGGKNIDQ